MDIDMWNSMTTLSLIISKDTCMFLDFIVSEQEFTSSDIMFALTTVQLCEMQKLAYSQTRLRLFFH